MMVGTLTRSSSNNTHMRTQSMDGVFENLPEVGENFIMVGKALDPLKAAGWRYIETTPVRHAEQESDVVQFETLNSSYELVVHTENHKLFNVSELEKLEAGLRQVLEARVEW